MADHDQPPPPSRASFKRLIVCCDGTWMNALGKQGQVHRASSPPSNVWRICRALKKTGADGANQLVYYHAGVGSSGSFLDSLSGGDFGIGLDTDIRELYTYICMNYVDGDEIVLLGFSRGAFAARAVADMIASLGLLTYAGLDHFAAVFTDYQTMGDIKHHRHPGDFLLFPGQLTPYDGQAKGPAKIRWEAERKRQYRELLKAADYTRDTWKYDDDDDDDNHRKITVKAVGVWDTVGALGIPPVPMLGVKGSARQWRFTNSSVAREVEHAFQALALDEPRAVFRPALWERAEDDSPTNLKQVWFPGNHGNVGGGYRDQQIADITLAWMADQLASVGVEFDLSALQSLFLSSSTPSNYTPKKPPPPWANEDIFYTLPPADQSAAAPLFGARPWALGPTRAPTSTLQKALGATLRRPGFARRVDEDTNQVLARAPLVRTGEAVHSCVRVRLACGGLGMDDEAVWACPSLLEDVEEAEGGGHWRLERCRGDADDDDDGEESPAVGMGSSSSSSSPSSSPLSLYPVQPDDGKYQWVYSGKVDVSEDDPRETIPQAVCLPEEPLDGPAERLLLALLTTASERDVWRYAEDKGPAGVRVDW